MFDAGCGCGGLLTKLRELSYVSTARGCEPYLGCSLLQSKNLDVHCNTIEAVTADKKYDVVTCIDVLVLSSVDVNQALSQLLELTSDKGLLVINVAAFPILYRYHDVNCGVARRFTYKSFMELLSNYNVTVENYFYWNMLISSAALSSNALSDRLKVSTYVLSQTL